MELQNRSSIRTCHGSRTRLGLEVIHGFLGTRVGSVAPLAGSESARVSCLSETRPGRVLCCLLLLPSNLQTFCRPYSASFRSLLCEKGVWKAWNWCDCPAVLGAERIKLSSRHRRFQNVDSLPGFLVPPHSPAGGCSIFLRRCGGRPLVDGLR